jgi:hypothetical protein
MEHDMPDEEQPTSEGDSYTVAAAMACRWLSAYFAQDDQAGDILRAMAADRRGLAMAFAALGEAFISTLQKLDADGAIEGGVQVHLDRLALNTGALADAVVTRYRGEAS